MENGARPLEKMVGKTEIIPNLAAAGSGDWSTASRKFYYYLLFSQALHFLKYRLLLSLDGF